MERLTSERGVIVVINAMNLLIMALIIGTRSSGEYPEPIFWVIVLVPPILAILSALLLDDQRFRRMAYVAAAVLMLPAVFFGIWGAWGLLYAIAIIFLLVAAFSGRNVESTGT